MTYITTAFKEGYVPPGALDWGDADDNNAFHAKQIVMDLDGTISTEVAMIHDPEKYDGAVTLGLPKAMTATQIPSPLTVGGALIPKGAKNIEVAKEFVKYCDPAEGRERVFEGRVGALAAGDAVDCQERSVVDRSEGPAPAGLRSARRARPDGAAPTTPTTRHAPRPTPQQVWGTAHASVIRDGVDAGSCGRCGLQADRHDPRQIPDRAELKGKTMSSTTI